jgi:phosphohistidine phosphatase SixA
MSSSVKIQKVVFVRHGVARHNLLDPVTGQRPNLEDPALFDPPLVFHGKQQALEVGERLKMWRDSTQLGDEVELVITSPLTRCIQTTMLGFLPGDCYTARGRHEPKIYCTELVREAFGMHYPDKRREKSLLMVGGYTDFCFCCKDQYCTRTRVSISNLFFHFFRNTGRCWSLTRV